MVRTIKQSAIVGATQRNRATGEVLMPNGERVFVLNRSTYQSAVRAADGKLNKILSDIKHGSVRKQDVR